MNAATLTDAQLAAMITAYHQAAGGLRTAYAALSKCKVDTVDLSLKQAEVSLALLDMITEREMRLAQKQVAA